jgi:hypothetical protein
VAKGMMRIGMHTKELSSLETLDLFYSFYSVHSDFELVYEQLNLKLDIVAKGMMRIGMHTKELSSLEILDLFYSFYNPSAAKIQPLTERALSLIHTELTKGEQL